MCEEKFEKKYKEAKESKAARNILSFWRISKSKKEGIYPDYLKVKNDGGFYHRFLKIRSLTAEQLLSGSCDHLVREALNYCATIENKHGLRMIAYALFSRKKTFLRRNQETIPITFLLQCVFSYSKSSARDIAFVIWDLFISGKQIIARASHLTQEGLPEQRWGDNRPEIVQNPNLVNISHGGGLFHILDFLSGRTQGYCLEDYGLGLQVSPAYDKSDSFYRRAASYAVSSYMNSWYDLPATLEAEISRSSLLPAHNNYEAGLRPEYKDKLKNIEIKEIKPDSSAEWPGVHCFNLAFIKNRYGKKYPEQQERLTNIILELFKEQRLEKQEEEYEGHSADKPIFQLKI